jgi:hypothetical protein
VMKNWRRQFSQGPFREKLARGVQLAERGHGGRQEAPEPGTTTAPPAPGDPPSAPEGAPHVEEHARRSD